MSIETSKLIVKLKRLLPDLAKTQEFYKDPKNYGSPKIFPFKPTPPAPGSDDEVKIAKIEIIKSINTALEKIRVFGVNAPLTQTEILRTCSIILTIRPAFLIQNNKYLIPNQSQPAPGSKLNWNTILDPHRENIEKTFESIGRIEFFDKTYKKEWNMGTGFLVADDVIMTARHVAEFFCDQNGNTHEWKFKTDTKERRIDYCEEKDTATPREYKIKKIVKICEYPTDLALLKVATTSKGRKHPEPLVLANTMPDPANDPNATLDEHRNVYAVGYPTEDTRESAKAMDIVFNKIYGVKRLQPGKFTGINAGGSVLYHDCSMMAGNSGSCVIDIDLNQVIGLHFRGIHVGEDNEAVTLPPLKNELKQYGVKFA